MKNIRSNDTEYWRMRWFFAWLYAVALIFSLLAGVIIVVITKNPLPSLIPTPLLLSMRPILGYIFPRIPFPQSEE